ncbi:MAG: sulfotransferase domain-containing protein [Caldilineaceae bacterium]|nr:sulfotransferase domain-containing protein [Caldilineaceae bacterium]
MAKPADNLSATVTVMREKAFRQALRTAKLAYLWSRRPRKHLAQTVLFIVGCQRSGTTMMTRIFEQDLNTKVFAETSRLSSLDQPKRLRLNPLDSVKRVIEQELAPIVILKPLVESQNIPELLDYFEGSKAIWLYRQYKDVAASYVEKWGEGHSAKDLRVIVEQRPNDWRPEHLPESVVQIVREHFSEEMNSHDASALYWYVRNSLFFSRRLDSDPRVMLCKYEVLAASPVEALQQIYQFIGHEFPGEGIASMVHEASVSRGQDIRLSPEIDCLCCELLQQLDNTFSLRSVRASRDET